MKKLLLAIAASVIGAGVTFANPTLVAWENDFSVLSKDGVTLDLQGNTPDEGGGITIGAKGAAPPAVRSIALVGVPNRTGGGIPILKHGTTDILGTTRFCSDENRCVFGRMTAR